MKKSKEKSVYIIGAGVSGLIAAINLEALGYHPTMLEANDRVGGRVQTDLIDGYQLDRGFQVLLSAYPMAKKYLDYDELELQTLQPGAMIFSEAGITTFGNPLRDVSFLFPTLLSSIGTLKDKWKIFKLNRYLRGKSLEDIFNEKETTTLKYLENYGFSDTIIANFFRPFFSGIFLEPDLATSSRMFEFVYKMFGEGMAVIPKGGMGAISKHLEKKLQQTNIRFNCKVKEVNNQRITLENGEVLETDFTIIATDPSNLLSNYSSTLNWKSCDNLYFTIPSNELKKPIIGLSTKKDGLVNNIFYPTSIATASKGKNQLLSVTVVKDHSLSEKDLIDQLSAELESIFNIREVAFLKRYQIACALPNLDNTQYSRDEGESLITERIAIAGDHLLNGSLNAAMISGEAAAEVAHRSLSDTTLTFA